jgi:hypothetical protein
MKLDGYLALISHGDQCHAIYSIIGARAAWFHHGELIHPGDWSGNDCAAGGWGEPLSGMQHGLEAHP